MEFPSISPVRRPLQKQDRAKLAKDTINTLIPKILASNLRAGHGMNNAELIRYSPTPKECRQPEAADRPTEHPSPLRAGPTIRVLQADTFDAARSILTSSPLPAVSAPTPGTSSSASTSSSPPYPAKRVAVLNMCSPLRPGGGVLNGALAQEESLCTRSTLFASLRDDFYRLPEDGAIYSPDVLVFRDAKQQDLPKQDCFFTDVISCAALRFPDLVPMERPDRARSGNGGAELIDSLEAGRQRERIQKREARWVYEYADETSREAMVLKVRLILQIAKEKRITHLVLGALGCGAYGNPPTEVARIFRRVICGSRRGPGVTGIEEIVFAIFDDGVNLRVFRDTFRDVAAS